MKEPTPEQLCQDLEGDVVFEYLKGQIWKGHRLVGGRIITPSIVGPMQARKVIEMVIEDTKTGKTNVFGYNYNRMKKAILNKTSREKEPEDC